MKMTVEEARKIGIEQLQFTPKMIDSSLALTREMASDLKLRPEDQGALALAMVLLGVTGTPPSSPAFQSELSDALELVRRAELAWRLGQSRH